MTLIWYHPIISGQKAQNSLTDCVNKSLIFNDVNGKMASARYLILYSDKDFLHQEIFTVKPDSARIHTKDEMKNLQYENPSHPLYLVFELAEKIELDAAYHFDNQSPFISSKLAELESNYQPFTMNLLELSQVRKLSN